LLSVPAAWGDEQALVRGIYERMLGYFPAKYAPWDSKIQLYLQDTSEINAGAGTIKGQKVIMINRGMLELIACFAYDLAYARERDLHTGIEQMLRTASARLAGQEKVDLPEWRKNLEDPVFCAAYNQYFNAVTAYIIGHEMGHFALKHTDTTYDDISKAASQEQELAADAWGLKLVACSGYKYHCLETWGAFMERLENFKGGDKIPEYLRTHPYWKRRIENLKQVFDLLKSAGMEGD